jgi:L-histidine N-alpha-methyltransferase
VSPLALGVGGHSRRGLRAPAVTFDVRLGDDERLRNLHAEARAGLATAPKALPPKWFYDQRGSALFDAITRVPEYYLTRCEREILEQRAPEIATLTGAESLIELGSGTSEKTRLLLDALLRRGSLRRFVPLDVCLPALEESAAALSDEYPELAVHAVVGDFHRDLARLPVVGRGLLAFLGSTIGNFAAAERRAFLAAARATLAPGDGLLLGADLVKDERRLNAAYNDAAGLTVAFNKNLLRVLNRDLGADFDEAGFDHVAEFDPRRALVDIGLRARAAQRVRVRALELDVTFVAGERMQTEISAKFTRAGLERELTAAGFVPWRWWTDRAGDFSLSLWRA